MPITRLPGPVRSSRGRQSRQHGQISPDPPTLPGTVEYDLCAMLNGLSHGTELEVLGLSGAGRKITGDCRRHDSRKSMFCPITRGGQASKLINFSQLSDACYDGQSLVSSSSDCRQRPVSSISTLESGRDQHSGTIILAQSTSSAPSSLARFGQSLHAAATIATNGLI